MFRGSSAITMDNKGRITIPTRYRDPLQEGCGGEVICTTDLNQPCLLLYPMSEWESVEKRLRGLSDMVPTERMFKRRVLGNAAELEIDKSGRLLIPPILRQFAQLEKQVTLVGQLNKFEIWSQQTWEAQMQADMELINSADFELTERLQDFTL
ncbi:division/cell wall cluster transcriptional repressor MraZ [Catenovulum sediminis]|uniref:Transcriptional regulator MraZ n=1 Tax=Catenovulum sediminis TaxID=1740262 RepID=A0ABV1RG25_9ALTE|nr:division/cell wall cluster transcriptional repressor MraZ [Catenovulum sediminis]